MRIFIAYIILLFFDITIVASGQQLHGKGLINEDISKISWIKKAEPKTILHKLASFVDNSEHLPPIGYQGAGDCAAWAVGYNYKTYQEWQNYGWSTTDPNHIFSPAFVYNNINGGLNAGTLISDGLKLLVDNGCATLLTCPYNVTDCTSWPSEAAYTEAINYRSDSAYYIDVKDIAGVEQVKQYVASGNICVFGINCYDNFDNINNYDNNYCVQDVSGLSTGWHAINIVGYDDNRVTRDGKGAFKLVNQWGSYWGDSGFCWMSYQAVMDSTMSSRQACYTTSKLNYKPVIIASVKITSPCNTKLKINFGIGSDTAPIFSKNFFDFDVNKTWPGKSFPNTAIVFDLTDGLKFLDTTIDNIVFLRTSSANSGVVNSFSVTDLRVSYTVNSIETPKNIPFTQHDIFTHLNFKLVKNYIVNENVFLSKGWNLVSVPLLSSDMSVSALFGGSNSPIYNYTGKYNIVTTLGTGTGYWVCYPDTTTVFIKGSDLNSTAIPLSQGWNLIGVYDRNIPVDQITTSSWGIINSPFYGYNNSYEIPDTLEVGKGYWVSATEAGVINIENAPLNGINKTIVNQYIDPNWLKITIQDKKGNRKTIYGTLSSINSESYSLPPVPPSGIFDVRWESNQLVDNIISGTKDILINSAEYPVALEVGGGDLNIQDAAGCKVLNEIVKSGKSITITNPGINELTVKLFAAPTMFELAQNYPNPFNPSTVISWQLAVGSIVTLKIYDVLGREVKTLVNESEPAGKYSITFNASGLSNGVYFYRIQAGNFVDTKKLIVMK